MHYPARRTEQEAKGSLRLALAGTAGMPARLVAGGARSVRDAQLWPAISRPEPSAAAECTATQSRDPRRCR